jgi:hypothetical protein
MPWNLLIRDALILAVTAWLARAVHGWQSQAGTRAAALAAIAVGGIAAYIWAYAVHEWGHFAGARLGGAAIRVREQLRSLQLFRFVGTEADRRPFLWMSWGGIAPLALFVALLCAWLPLETPAGASAAALTLLGLGVTLYFEWPVVWRVTRGSPVPARFMQMRA